MADGSNRGAKRVRHELIDDSARQRENKTGLPQWGKSVKGQGRGEARVMGRERERKRERQFSGVDLHFNLHPMQPTYIRNSSSSSTVLPGVDNSRIPNS